MRLRLGRGSGAGVVALRASAAAALLAWPAASALGQAAVPTPDGRYRVAYGPAVMLSDNAVFRTLIGGTNFPLISNTTLAPTVRMAPRACGLDLVVTYVNGTPTAQPLGSIAVDGVRLPGACKQWTFGQDTITRTLAGYTWYNQNTYPIDWYSPVMVAGDERHILGFQLMYPLIEYNHTVRMSWVGINTSSAARGDPHWSAQFDLLGEIPAGQTRTYTLAIRATTADKSFLNTLTPYRDYFRAAFGPVHYLRDSRPVEGESASTIPSISATNPQGWALSSLRPDHNGWAPWVNLLLSRRGQGYQRVMMWVPSGIFPQASHLNFPYRFMTPINDYPAARDSMSEFQRVRGGGMELGFWWGNNATLMRGWGMSATAEAFDPNNPEHVRLAYSELDMAVRAGATMIGLDAFKQANPGNMYKWLKMLKERAPNVKFITENAAPDYIHNLAPTFHEAAITRNPHLLADFLNPGHETWAGISTTPEASRLNRAPTQAEIAREAQRVATLGYVPLCYGPFQLPPSLRAVESWMTTVPRELRPDANTTARTLNRAAVRNR